MNNRSLSSLTALRTQIKWLIGIVVLAVLAPITWFSWSLYQRHLEADRKDEQLDGALNSSYEAMASLGLLSIEINKSDTQTQSPTQNDIAQRRYERLLVNRLLVVVPTIREYRPFEQSSESDALLERLAEQVNDLNEAYAIDVTQEDLVSKRIIIIATLSSAEMTLNQYRLILRELNAQQNLESKAALQTTVRIFIPLTVGFMLIGGVIVIRLFRNLSAVLEKDYDLRASLSERERWFQALFDRSPVAIGVSRDGINLHVNDAYLRLFGQDDRDKVIGSSILDHIAPESRAIIKDRITNIAIGKDEYENIEVVARKPDGTEFPYMATVGRITLPDGPGFIGFFTDISEEKKKEKELLWKNEIVNHMYAGTAMLSLADRSILYTNPQFSEMFGYEQDELLGQPSNILVEDKATANERSKQISETLQTTGLWQGELENTRKDGSRFWCRAIFIVYDHPEFGSVALCVQEDINEQRMVQEALAKSEERLNLMFKSTSDMLLLLKVMPDGTMILDAMNESYRKQTSKLLNKNIGNDIIGKERTEVLLSWGLPMETIAAELPLYESAIREHKSGHTEITAEFDGNTIVLEVAIEPILDANGNCSHVLWNGRDVTERRIAEDMIRDSAIRLNEAQRIAKVGSWELDIQSDKIIWSDEIFKMFEIDKQKFGASYDAFLDAIHPEDREMVNLAYTTSLTTGKPYEITHRLQMADGRIKYVEEICESFFEDDGTPTRSIGTIQDITKQHVAEEEIERLAKIVRNSSDFIGIADIEGNVIFLNDAGRDLVGIQDDEHFFSTTVQDYFPNEDRIKVDEEIIPAVMEFGRWAGEMNYKHFQTGEHIPVWFDFFRIDDPITGKPINFATVTQDIREQKRREEELQMLNESLEQRVKERTKKIQESEAKFRSLSEASPVGIQFVSQDGVTEFSNDSWNKILGINWQDQPELGWMPVLHPEDKEGIAAGWEEFVSSDQLFRQSEARIIHAEKGMRWVTAYTSKIQNNGESAGFAVVLTDVTEERVALQNLAESEDRFRAISEASPISILITDKEGAVVYANESYTSLMDVPFEKVKDWGWADFIHPEDVEELTSLWQEYVEHGGMFINSHRICRHDGSVAWLSCVAAPLKTASEGHVVMLEDITERVESQLALGESEERFRSMTEASPAGISITRMDGEVLYFNDSYVEMLGLTPDQAKDTKHTPPFHPDDELELNTAWQEFVNGGFDRYYKEARLLTPDGGLKWIKHHAAPMRVAGAIVAYVGVFVDNTEIRNAQSDLVSAKETAEHANKAKDEFLSRVSHELRTPLNAILGFAQVMGMEEQTRDNSDSIRHIVDAGQHLLSLVNEVLDIAQIESGDIRLNLVDLDASKHLEECLRLISPLTDEKNITVNYERSKEPHRSIKADSKRLNQVLINVLSNAIKYNKQSGSVDVSIVYNEPLTTTIIISDTGAGIHPDLLTRVFAPFDRLGAESTDVSGTGIGLSLTASLMDVMGGSIEITSEVGVGTTVNLVLPCSGSTVSASTKETDDPNIRFTSLPEKKLKIHLVEDNRSNFMLMQTIFNKRGSTELVLSENATDAINQATLSPPDLFLLDVNLPDSKDTQLLEKIRSIPTLRDIPVVVVSANANHAMIDAFNKIGVLAYLTKPVEISRLISIIDSIELRTNRLT